MVDEWNKNMAQQFTPSWVSCLDESMSPWTNKYRCPGWMFVPRKPHPFGNEYTIQFVAHVRYYVGDGACRRERCSSCRRASKTKTQHPQKHCGFIVVNFGTHFWKRLCCCVG